MKRYDFDLIVLGGGAAGLTAATVAKGFGKRIALVEQEKIGGECTWTGCIPSKTLINSAKIAWQTHKQGYAPADSSNILPHVRNVIAEIYAHETPAVLREKGINVLEGRAHFIDAHTVRINDKNYTAKRFILATGSAPAVPPIPGIDMVPYLTNKNFFSVEKLPASLVILGGGAIGVEMASALVRLGIQITILELGDRLLPNDDAELAELLQKYLQEDGVSVQLGVKTTRVQERDGSVGLFGEKADGSSITFTGEKLLIATGRSAMVSGFGLEELGVQASRTGVVVDDTLRTTVKTIYACGDVVGPYRFSHMAWYQGMIAARNALLPFKKKVDYGNVIWATFSDPELAGLGLTELQAKEAYGDKVQVYRREFQTLDRAHTDRTLRGMAKVITDKKGIVLGAHVLGARAGDIVHEMQVAKQFGVRLHQLQSMIHAYPTYSEIFWHIGKEAYVQKVHNNFFVKLAKRFMK